MKQTNNGNCIEDESKAIIMNTLKMDDLSNNNEEISLWPGMTIFVPQQRATKTVYTAAARYYFGAKKLRGPVVDVRDGNTYTFDFFDSSEDTLYKVMSVCDKQVLDIYIKYPALVRIILDSECLPIEYVNVAGYYRSTMRVEKSVDEVIREEIRVSIYHDGKIWFPRSWDMEQCDWTVVDLTRGDRRAEAENRALRERNAGKALSVCIY